ncbi:protein of unknown function [Pseudomonas inefficax]|uniref:Uncharacterized protein n=1 Tax=Pseudomonas inefficax TaxID=2078786 RepID=A0AAQ1PCI9_9PSED|nr:protein of unknown function [Pseudomonas inefficax]
MAPASPVFAAEAAPTGTAHCLSIAPNLWERASPRRAAAAPIGLTARLHLHELLPNADL